MGYTGAGVDNSSKMPIPKSFPSLYSLYMVHPYMKVVLEPESAVRLAEEGTSAPVPVVRLAWAASHS